MVAGIKDIENRTWPTQYRGPMLVHASGRRDAICDDEVKRRFGVCPPAEQPLGGVIGVVDIIDCVRDHLSIWYSGDWGFVLANARPLPFVAWKGALMLRHAPPELLATLRLLSCHTMAAYERLSLTAEPSLASAANARRRGRWVRP